MTRCRDLPRGSRCGGRGGDGVERKRETPPRPSGADPAWRAATAPAAGTSTTGESWSVRDLDAVTTRISPTPRPPGKGGRGGRLPDPPTAPRLTPEPLPRIFLTLPASRPAPRDGRWCGRRAGVRTGLVVVSARRAAHPCSKRICFRLRASCVRGARARLPTASPAPTIRP